MENLFKIFNLISSEQIILEEFDSIINQLDGIYFKLPDIPPTIGVNKAIVNDSKKYISTLGEELGHHFTTSGNLIINSKNYSEKILKSKMEMKAKRWAADFLISDEDFVQALNNCVKNLYEMSEEFNVSEELIKYKVDSILSDELKYKKIRNNFIKREIPYYSCSI